MERLPVSISHMIKEPTMTISKCSLLTALVLLLSLPAFRAAGQQTPDRPRLPGAKPVIDASRYPDIQAAIDALGSDGGCVRLPPGVFEISKPLVIPTSDTTLEGAGTATHLKNINEEGKATLRIENPNYPDRRPPQDEKIWRVRVANLRMTGNPKSGPGILARNINEIFLQGVTVSYHGDDGIRLDHCYEDPRICDCLITYNQKTGLNLLGCHDIVVSACQFEENHDALRCFDGFNLCMTGCCVDDHLGRGVVVENTYGSVVSGNMIEECKAAAIVLDRDCYGIALSANVIAHNGAGIDLRDAHGCSVSANSLVLMKSDALRIGPDSGRIAVTGNSFADSFLGEGRVKRAEGDRQAAGLVLEGGSDSAVVGNTFSGLHTPAVEKRTEQPTPRILFDGNVLTETPVQKIPELIPGENLMP